MVDINENLSNTEVKVEKLANWKNIPKLLDIKQDFADGQIVHNVHVQRVNNWLDNLHTKGTAAIKGDANSSKMVPKLIRKQAEWRYAPLSEPFLSTEDLFNINPVTFEDVQGAKQNQILINNQFATAIDKQAFIDEYVRTAVDEGTVVTKVSWEFKEEEVTEETPIVEYLPDASFAESLQMLIQMQQESPSDFMAQPPEMKRALEIYSETGIPVRPNITEETETITYTKTVFNRPVLEIVNYKNIVFDPTCKGDLKKAKFAVHSFDSSIDELRKDGKYKNLSAVVVQNNEILGQPDYPSDDPTQSFNFNDNLRKKILVHEYWGMLDIHGTGETTAVVIAWIGNVIIRMEENPYPDKQIPFVAVQYLPVRKSIYGEPDGALLEDNQKIFGATMRGIIDLLGKSANSQTGIAKGSLDATNQRRYEQGKTYYFNPNMPPQNAFYTHTYPEIPNSALSVLQLMNAEAESLSGVKAYNEGISSSSLGDVAAGIRGALDAASKRELGILRRLSKGIIEIGRKIIAMNAVFLSEEEVVRISNEQFVPIKRDDLPGNYDLKLSISTAEEDSNKAQEISFMMQTMGNTLPPEITTLLLSKFFDLRKLPDIAKMLENYKPEPDPIQQEMAMLELEKKRAEVRDENAQAALREAQAQLEIVKIQTEIAKARAMSSQADQADLDFVEQESGVKQERELQKQGAQARAQTDMAIQTKAMDASAKDKEFVQKMILNQQAAELARQQKGL